MCSDECQVAEQHLPECRAFQSMGVRGGRDLTLTLLDQPEFLHEIILVLRCLALRQSDTMKWMNLMELESHMEMREGSEMDERSEKVGLWICKHFNHLEVNVETVKEICAILDVNSFEVPVTRSSTTIQAIYSTAGCLVEHDCVPTSHKSFGEDFRLTLRAAVDIKKDQHISISYTDSLWPTVERRNHLMMTKYFECICLRCCDPKELNTYLGGIKCMKCPIGYLLTEDPLESDSSWQCEDCAHKVPSEFVQNINSQVAETIQLLELSGLEPSKCEKFLTVHLRILHPQHAHMLDVKHSLLHLLGHHEGYLMADLSDQLLQMKEEIARSLLEVADKLIPGLSRLRGTTLYELFLTHQQRGLNWSKPGHGQKSQKDILSTFKVKEQCCFRNYQLIHCEIKFLGCGEVFVSMFKNIAI